MIVRIVNMHFKEDNVEEFLNYFKVVKEKVRTQPGCQSLKLLQDIHNKTQIKTYSHWDSEAELNQYRDTELFKKIWAKTKSLFEEKASAASLHQLHEL